MMEKSSHCDGILQDPEFRRTSKCLFYGNRLKERSFLIFPFKKDCKSIDYEKVIVDGFDQPILVDAGTDIGITVPKRDVSLIEVAKLIGIHVPVKIIEVGTQSEIVGWTFGQYIEYLRRRGPNHKILNLISLEFSMTPMSNFVHAPEIVRKIDWIDVLWPLNKRTHGDYPQVQKYCLTGMAGSYTDFHIDFGGTSVWYHVVWGCKRFFLIDPTCANLKAYEKWSCNPNQDQVFLGDVVDRCYQVDVMPGQTFFIPSGWIHAVYTPEDSLVFGGNFLHCFAMLRQLQADSIERRTRVAQQYRFPHFQRIHWYSIVSLLPYALQRVLNRSVDELRSESVAVLRELDSNSRLTAIVNHCIAEDYFEDCTLRICDALLDTVVIRQLPYVLRAMEGWLHGGSISSAAHNISIVESHSVHEDVYLYAHVVLQMDVESEPNCLSNLLDIWWRVLDTIAIDDVQGNSNSHLVGLREHISFVRGLTLEQCDWLDPSVVAGGLFSDNQLSNIAIENAVESMVKEESLVYDKTQHGHTESVSSIAPSSSPTASLPPRPLKLKLVLRPPVDPSSAPQNSINNLTTTADHPFTDTAHTDNLPLKRKKTCTIKQSVEFADLVTQADSFTLDNSDKVNNESSIIAATAEAVVSAVKLPVSSPSPASAVLVKDEVESEGRYKTRGHRVSAEFIQHATDIDIVAFATDLSMHTHDLGAAHVDSSSRVGSRHDLATFKGEGEDAMKEDEDLMVEDEEDDMDNDSAFDSEYSDEEYTKVKRRKPSNKQPTAPLVSKSSAAIIGSAKKETVVKKNSSSKSGNNNSARQNILKKLGMRR